MPRKSMIVISEASQEIFFVILPLIHVYTGWSSTVNEIAKTMTDKNGHKIASVKDKIINNNANKKYFSVEVIFMVYIIT